MKAGEMLHAKDVERQLSEAREIIAALLSGQIDAVVDSKTQSPVLLSKAQDALRESEERYRRIVETTNEGIWTIDTEGKITFVNGRLSEMLGYAVGELLGKSSSHLEHEAARANAAARVERSRQGSSEETELAFVRRDGSEVWTLLKTSPIRDTDGTYVGTLAMITDRTHHKQAEEARHLAVEAVRTSEAEFRLLAEAMPQIVWITRPDGGNIYFNQRWMDYTGLTLEESLSDGWAKPFHPDDKPLAWQAWQNATATGGAYSIECRLQGADATYRWWLIRGVPVKNASGNILKWFGTCTDIDALKQGEARLRESEGLLRIAGHAARLGGWSVSLHDLRVIWSDEVCAIHEVPPGTTPSLAQAIAAYAPEFRETIREQFDACVRDGTPYDLELQIVTATNRRIWVRAIGNAERSASGAVTGLRGAFQDIDDRRKLEDQFRQAQKMEAVGRLAAGVAHDFNNLLSVVLGFSELAIDALKPGDPLRRDIEEIRKAGNRATALTRQLLAFSRQQVLAPRVVDLNEIVLAMKPMLSRLLGEDIDLTVLSRGPSGRVLVDPSQVEQVVMNFAVNARDAMPDGGMLAIETSNVTVDEAFVGRPAEVPPGRFVMLAVTDSGVGMTEATRARLFEPFFTTKEKGKGTGLGLATVFGIVQQSGGYVSVYSELSHGTTFKVYLPRTDRVAEASCSNAPATTLKGSETILLVEDEEQVRSVACAVLRRHGYNVLETSNGGEAYLVSNDFAATIDLLLTDVVMPRMSGRRLAEHLAALRPKMRVLFASGYTDDAIIHHGVLNAGVAFLQKPFTPQALLRKVRDVLDAVATK
jgi:PAS domain S-box-containing protein